MIRTFKDKITLEHIRNIRIYENGDFIKTFHKIGYTGYRSPDNEKHI